MRVCAACKFYRYDPAVEAKDYEAGRAERHACTAIIDLVTGEQKDVECYEARAADWLCGTDGKLFKEPERTRRLVDDPNSASGKRVVRDFDPFGDRVPDRKPGRSDG